ncbi:NlpC/P60 family protein [Nakamurella antarctica]|uniref:NlpC/P60 family protein n=1 Tax=Nakamurella antarctica TaxID=1902245 RepID=A0A3G8ZKT3_9ACTN|nr:C40 family peptidase [Nakamurella antarctica]AZI57788.1 NlpC/P60 family protein [Nakamurella antarctica]
MLTLTTLTFGATMPASAEPAAPVPTSPTAVSPTGSTLAPAAPATAEEAKTAWIAAAQAAEQLNQAVLTAQETVKSSEAAVGLAHNRIAPAQAAVAQADATVRTAAAEVSVYQAKLDAFASASLRGARMSQISSLLTANSPEEYLDEVTALNRVASDAKTTMAKAAVAKIEAQAAKTAADSARDAATVAVADAQAAKDAAVTAAADLAAQQVAMSEQVKTFEKLYSSLTLQERVAAVSAAENAINLSTDSAQRQRSQAAARAAAGISDDTDQTTTLNTLATELAPDTAAAVAVAAALTRQGMPYVWAAVGPDSFDCSGLMLWAWQQAGITIPRTSAEQYRLPEVPLSELKPGDLITYYSPVTHVGMYVGMGLVLHASMPGVPIKVVDLYRAGPNPTGHRVPR